MIFLFLGKKALKKNEGLKLVSNIRLQLNNLYKNQEWFNYVGTSQYQEFDKFNDALNQKI